MITWYVLLMCQKIMTQCPLKNYKVICKLKKKELREDKKSHERIFSIPKPHRRTMDD